MKFFTKNVGSNYLAKVVELGDVRKHPNADKLQLTQVDHQTVVVGLNAKKGDLCIYFPLECAINKDFLKFTNSFSDPLLNADGKTKGFFNDKGRVKAIKLRGTPSEGYIVPVKQIEDWATKSSVDFKSLVGKEFDTIEYRFDDGDLGTKELQVLLCEKYVPYQPTKGPANLPKKDKTRRFDRMIPGQFHFHVETAQLKKNIDSINPADTITITEKLHGTSAVFSNILVKRQLSWRERLAKFLGCKVQETEQDVIYSSRAVVKNAYLYKEKVPNHWYKEDIWGLALERIREAIIPGVSIYAEIVGYTPSGSCIQKGYDYGCAPGEFEIYVYRMTSVNNQGYVLEWTTNQIKNYCDTHRLKMVPIHYHGTATGIAELGDRSLEDWQAWLLHVLSSYHLEKPCKMCKNNVPAEGIVLTVEKDQFTAYKLKSWAFYEGETKALDSGQVDIEAEQSING